jgi:tetratricopeptide (TPR) repeat protein
MKMILKRWLFIEATVLVLLWWGIGWADQGGRHTLKEVNAEKAAEIFQESLHSDSPDLNRQYLQKILELAPDSPYGHFSKGWFYAQEEKYPQAIDEYRQAVLQKPDFNEARHNLASAYFYVGDFQKAIGEYQNVIKQSPLWAEAHLNLGTAYFLAENPFLAIEEYDKALRLNPRLSVVHYYMGLVLEKMGRSKEAFSHFVAFEQAHPEEDFPEYAERAKERIEDLWVMLGRQNI